MNDEIRDLETQIQSLRQQLGEARRRAGRAQPVNDYTLRTPEGEPIRLSDLFGPRRDLLLIHNMGRTCSGCTMLADGLNGLRRHLESRAALVLCSPDQPAILADFARSRGWGFRTVSSAGSTLHGDLGFAPKGGVWPGVSALWRDEDGSITRTGSAQFGPHDDFCPTWHLFDLLRDGANGWEPRFEY